MLRFSAHAALGLSILVTCTPCAAQTNASDTSVSTAALRAESSCPVGSFPLTVAEHLVCFNDSVWSWKTVVEPLVTASAARWLGLNAGFPNTFNGFEGHYGVNLAGDIGGKFFGNFLMPSFFHEDPRYISLGPAAQWYDRIEHIAAHLIHTRSNHILNYSAVTSFVANAALANLYEPASQRTVSATGERVALNLAGYVAGDALNEFTPEIERLGKCIYKWDFAPCSILKPVPIPSAATIDLDNLDFPWQKALATDYLSYKNQKWSDLKAPRQLEFAGATQALGRWCQSQSNCQPGLDQVTRINDIEGSNPGMKSEDQFFLGVGWKDGSKVAFGNIPGWSPHWAALHDGMTGYSENRDGDPYLGLVVLFDSTEPVGQFHIGFRSIFDHYLPVNGDISQNYALYCEWYGPLKGVSTPCPTEKRNARAVKLADYYVPRPTSKESVPKFRQAAPSDSEFEVEVKAFLTAWYLNHADYSKLKELLAKDDAFSFPALRWQMHTKAFHYKSRRRAWQDIFDGAFQPYRPKLQNLEDAIKFVTPLPTRTPPLHAMATTDWRAKVAPVQSDRDQTKKVYGYYKAEETPQGTFFPNTRTRGPLFAAKAAAAIAAAPRFDPRAQYLDHLQQVYARRLKVVVYTVIGEGLVPEGVVLYWIAEGEKWKLAAFQGTD